MRRFFLLAMAVFALGLSGCARETPVAEKPDPVVETSAVESTSAIPPGVSFTMRSGLSLTVPSGARAVLTTYTAPSGDLRATDYLLIEQVGPARGSRVVMVYSSVASTVPPSVLGTYGLDDFSWLSSNRQTTTYVGRKDFPKAPRRLFSVVTFREAPHSGYRSHAVLFFAGSSTDVTGSISAVWRSLDIRGVDPPAGFEGKGP